MKNSLWIRAFNTARLLAGVGALGYGLAHLGASLNRWPVLIALLVASTTSDALPMAIIHKGSRGEFCADGMIVVACALLVPPSIGALIVGSGYLLGATVKHRFLSLLVDSAAITLVTLAALTASQWVAGGVGGLTPRTLLGAAIAIPISDGLSLLMLAIEKHLSGRAGLWDYIRGGLGAMLPLWPFLISIGIVLGVLGQTAPWALPLMWAPLVIAFMASKANVQASEDRTRLDNLLAAATTILDASSVASVIETATRAASAMFEGEHARIDTEVPAPGELSVPLPTARFGTLHFNLAARGRLGGLNIPYTDQDRRVLEVLSSMTVSALDKAAEHDAERVHASRDALTELANRRSFEDELSQAMVGSRESDKGIGVVFVDLDKFKEVNDEHGHEAGDEVLVEVAKRLVNAVRASDTVARLGGDEFTVLLRGVFTVELASQIAERLVLALRHPIRLSSGVEVPGGGSVGIALSGEGGGDPAELLRAGDAAMYEAKRGGRTRWCLAPATGFPEAADSVRAVG
jgi:diguanylate cyclase (GGDEF)-like protein